MTTEDNGNGHQDSYKVDLAVFQGPLDLLLYLIRKEEVDIYDIPIAKITRQYLKYLEMMTDLNLEIAGEFILMAATLIRIKTRLLLPRDPDEPEEADPRFELITALVEYKKFKEAGDLLRDRVLEEEQKYVPTNPLGKIEGRVEVEPVTTLFDLLVAFKQVMIKKPEEIFHEVTPEEVSIEERMKSVMLRLRQQEFALFEELFLDVPRKIVAVVTFIAILELARARRVAIFQSQPFAEIRVYRGEMFNVSRLETDIVDLSEITEGMEA